jgi:uncharacterized protein (TIGR04562 family)
MDRRILVLPKTEPQELYHDIFGSVLDRKELTPYLLRNCDSYETALRGASFMLGNRGFAIFDGALATGELERASAYISAAIDYMAETLLPTIRSHLVALLECADPSNGKTPQQKLYEGAIANIDKIASLLTDGPFAALVAEDPRHLFLLASSFKYPRLFRGHASAPESVPVDWRLAGCSILKMGHLIKSIEEDSQDIYDYARLGFFFESRKIPLHSLFGFPWDAPPAEPANENARKAYVKLSAFFRKLRASITIDRETNTLVFNSGDGVNVEIVEIKARLKSPESMFSKLGKDSSEQAYDIRDILAITFLLKNRDDSLLLFHALQKQGIILQETTAAASITQTLFDSPEDMTNAVRILMECLLRREGIVEEPCDDEVRENAKAFYGALNTNTEANPLSSGQHRKFQCKLNFSVPVQLERDTGRVIIPIRGATPVASERIVTRQQTLPVELRISDVQSWEASELKGEAHHGAYKCRQLLAFADRLFSPLFSFPQDAFAQLRKDQDVLFR